MKNAINDSILVGVDFTHGNDEDTLIVGRRTKKQDEVQVINAFQGQEARDLYHKLVTRKAPVQ